MGEVAEAWRVGQATPAGLSQRAAELELLYLPALNYAAAGGKPSLEVWIQCSDQTRSARAPVKTVHFPIHGVLHLASKFYLNPLTLVKYSNVQ